MWLFGSIPRVDFDEQSDIDMIVHKANGSDWRYHDIFLTEDELREKTGRSVQVVTRRAIDESTNPFRRRHVLGTMMQLYATR